ncbi:unnamed protein product [Arabidopsis lyrata]|nr:proline-rich receptor-like protein kinase PERK5 [Arabidopsis lyrata subsp. lyrata]CAH8258456.1 unnamed protein product [Arabidopsis lyrata]|eukprot:XP_020891586.1 proline-rich receptor-like protein kinase PERK5 [Arabidopsis lyrata subsp. lyrata]
MAIVHVDDSFKRPGTIPFSWEIRPGVPKTRMSQPGNTTPLQPPKKLSPLRLKPLSHSQPLLPPALSPPSSSFISNSKSRPLSPLTPHSFSTTPSKLKPPPTPSSFAGFYSPGPSFRSSPRAFSERWQLHRPNRIRPGSEPEPSSDFSVAGFGCFPSPRFRLRKNKSGGSRRKTGSRSENDYYCSDMETMSPWTVSSRRSVSPRWESPKSSFSSLRFSPRIANEAEWVGFGLF